MPAAVAAAALALLACTAPQLTAQAFAQRVCSFDDPQCNQQRIDNTRDDAVSRERHRRNDARALLPQRYYGDRSSWSATRPENSDCDVSPVISGQDTRVVRSC